MLLNRTERDTDEIEQNKNQIARKSLHHVCYRQYEVLLLRNITLIPTVSLVQFETTLHLLSTLSQRNNLDLLCLMIPPIPEQLISMTGKEEPVPHYATPSCILRSRTCSDLFDKTFDNDSSKIFEEAFLST